MVDYCEVNMLPLLNKYFLLIFFLSINYLLTQNTHKMFYAPSVNWLDLEVDTIMCFKVKYI